MLICRLSSRAAVGHRCGNGSQQPPTPQCSGQWCAHLQHVSGMLVGLLGSSPPSCQAASWEHRGSKGVPLRSPLRLPPGEGGHMLAAGKVRNVFFFFFLFIPKISSPTEAQDEGRDTSVHLVQRPFASELLSQQCSKKGSLCPGWDKGTSLIKLA